MNRRHAIVLLALLTGCGEREASYWVGTLERDRLELTAEANEPIVSIEVREGDRVVAGTSLMKLDTRTIQARRDQAAAAVDAAERRLAELIAGPRAQEIRAARAALDSTTSVQRTAANEYARIEDLVGRRLLSESALDNARAQRDSAESARKQAQARLDLLLEGTRRESIEQAQAELQGAKAALIAIETSLARHAVIAPRDGLIEALPYKLGERPPQGMPIVIMLADGTPYARVHVPETSRAHVRAGDRVRISVDGIERDYEGVIRFIAAQAQFTPYFALTQEDRSRLSYLAEIDLIEQEATELPVGMPVEARRIAQ